MVRLIISLVILVVLAVLLVFNGTFMTPVNLFGYRIERVPVVVVAIVGFVFGILYSFVLYFMRFLARRRSATIKSKDREVKMREQEIKEKEKNLDTMAEDLADSRSGAASGPADQESGAPEPPAAKGRKKKK
jgi:uncharacterized integral membrane protein